MHYWEWKGDQPTVLICHGGSLHGRCYDRIVNEALSGFHVISLSIFVVMGDHKNILFHIHFHGLVEMFSNLSEMLELSKTNLIGIGHSLGGHALVSAAAIAPKRVFQSLLLLDPGIFSSTLYERGNKDMKNFEHMAPRKNQWSSIEDMISSVEKPGRLSNWPKDILRDYCTYALDENFQLQCTSERAWHLYRISVSSDANIFQIIKDSKCIHDIPIHVVRAAKSELSGKLPVPKTAPDLAKCFKKGRDTQLKDGNHSFPMEHPEIVIRFVKEMIEENKNLRSHL